MKAGSVTNDNRVRQVINGRGETQVVQVKTGIATKYNREESVG